mmetsp:Transcript_79265/g.220356  ORF Transcript_79265/g.220356 Transcript_79265/m.220356 type:complete len:220 (-) Transcript_79265:756-1415(-)
MQRGHQPQQVPRPGAARRRGALGVDREHEPHAIRRLWAVQLGPRRECRPRRRRGLLGVLGAARQRRGAAGTGGMERHANARFQPAWIARGGGSTRRDGGRQYATHGCPGRILPAAFLCAARVLRARTRGRAALRVHHGGLRGEQKTSRRAFAGQRRFALRPLGEKGHHVRCIRAHALEPRGMRGTPRPRGARRGPGRGRAADVVRGAVDRTQRACAVRA